MNQRTLLVTGANGNLGRRVLELVLAQRRAGDIVIAGTRDPSKLHALAGVEARRVDFDHLTDAAFAGVDRLLLISTDAVGVPGRRSAQHKAAFAAAAKAGVKHVVYTSVVNPRPGAVNPVADDHRLTEEAIASGPMGFTILRNSLYLDFILPAVSGAAKAGVLADATGEGRIARVSREDCARAAAAALVADFEGRRTLDITGPRAVSSKELSELVGRHAKKSVRHQPLSAAEAQAALVQHGVPAEVAPFLVGFDVAIAGGELDVASRDLFVLTGKPGIDVDAFLSENKAGWLA